MNHYADLARVGVLLRQHLDGDAEALADEQVRKATYEQVRTPDRHRPLRVAR